MITTGSSRIVVNVGWTDAARAAASLARRKTSEANLATANLRGTYTGPAHVPAARGHEEAAAAHREAARIVPSEPEAAEHLRQAQFHDRQASLHRVSAGL